MALNPGTQNASRSAVRLTLSSALLGEPLQSHIIFLLLARELAWLAVVTGTTVAGRSVAPKGPQLSKGQGLQATADGGRAAAYFWGGCAGCARSQQTAGAAGPGRSAAGGPTSWPSGRVSRGASSPVTVRPRTPRKVPGDRQSITPGAHAKGCSGQRCGGHCPISRMRCSGTSPDRGGFRRRGGHRLSISGWCVVGPPRSRIGPTRSLAARASESSRVRFRNRRRRP